MDKLISMRDAIKAIEKKAKQIKNEDTLNGLAGAVEILFDLPPVNPQEPKTESKYCDRNICLKNEYNNIGCDECEVTKSQEPKWIPINKKLPKAGEYVGDVAKYYLVQNEYGDMLVARYTHSGYWEQIYQLKPISDEILAWMPLPERYKPTESEE